MKMIKLVGFAGLASLALLYSTNSLTLAESQSERGLGTSVNSESFANRVTHTLANDNAYAVRVSPGYKWGQKVLDTATVSKVSNAGDSRGGYKWGQSSSFEQAGSRWGRMSSFEQAGSRWGRMSSFEQAGSRWGRMSSFEQAGSRWGRL